MLDYLKPLAAALALTIFVEVVVARLFKLRTWREIRTVILINVITNPLLNYLLLVNHNFRVFPNLSLVVLVLEILVVIAETFLLHRFLRHRLLKMIVLSVVMNTLSYCAGLLVMPF